VLGHFTTLWKSRSTSIPSGQLVWGYGVHVLRPLGLKVLITTVWYESNILLNYVLDVIFELQNEYAQMIHTDKYIKISTVISYTTYVWNVYHLFGASTALLMLFVAERTYPWYKNKSLIHWNTTSNRTCTWFNIRYICNP
jgi:hypothetical protein